MGLFNIDNETCGTGLLILDWLNQENTKMTTNILHSTGKKSIIDTG